jgi:hypothetical protein
MIVIPWVTEEVPLVFSDKEQLLPKVLRPVHQRCSEMHCPSRTLSHPLLRPSSDYQVDEMNRLVEAVDTEDPWVRETFGVTGTGEGVVWYPVGLDVADGTMPVNLPKI